MKNVPQQSPPAAKFGNLVTKVARTNATAAGSTAGNACVVGAAACDSLKLSAAAVAQANARNG